jgi:hypothetical protein
MTPVKQRTSCERRSSLAVGGRWGTTRERGEQKECDPRVEDRKSRDRDEPRAVVSAGGSTLSPPSAPFPLRTTGRRRRHGPATHSGAMPPAGPTDRRHSPPSVTSIGPLGWSRVRSSRGPHPTRVSHREGLPEGEIRGGRELQAKVGRRLSSRPAGRDKPARTSRPGRGDADRLLRRPAAGEGWAQ